MSAQKITVEGGFYRAFEIDRSTLNKDARTVAVKFSSEYPVRRRLNNGMVVNEILSHEDGACDLSRVRTGTAVLLEHDPMMRVGITESGSIDSGKREGVAVVRFAKTKLGDEAMSEVEDSTLRWLSMGYTVAKLTEDGEDADGIANVKAKRWQPFEISFVGVPADPTCRVRSAENITQEIEFESKPEMKRNLLLDAAPADGGTATADAGKAQRERIGEIRKLGKQFRGRIENVDDLVDAAIDGDTEVADFQRTLLSKMATKPIPGGSDAPEQRDGTETASSGGQPAGNTETRSLGEIFVASREYREFSKRNSNKAIIEVRGTLPQMLTRATLTSSGLTSIQKIPGVVLVDQQPLRVADIFAQGTTTSTTIRFTKEDSFTNAATAVAEEGQKPEASFALSESDVTVKKIAVVGRVTDEMLADYEYATSYVNSRLLFMVAALEDNHLLNGTGSSNQITGVLNVSGIQTQAYASNLADTIHKAITKIMSTPGFIGSPEHLVIHPTDWQNLVLTRDSSGQYYAGGPFMGQYGVGGISRNGPWGLTPVITTAIAQGTALVAAGRLGATIFRRNGITIESTNSDASDFQYNRIAIRAEERLCLVPYRPKAFCKITSIPLA